MLINNHSKDNFQKTIKIENFVLEKQPRKFILNYAKSSNK